MERPARPQPPRSRPSSEAPPARRARWVGAAVVLLAILAYLNAWPNHLTYDDRWLIGVNPAIRSPANFRAIWLSDYWSMREAEGPSRDKLYRPLTVFSFALNYALGSLDPGGYRLFNWALHAAASTLLFALALRLWGSLPAAFWGAALFALHPLHTEAVNAVVGRADLLATSFLLAGLLFHRRYRETDRALWHLLTLLSFALSLLSKESGASFLLFLPLADFCLFPREARRGRWADYARLGGVFLLYLSLRYAALGALARPLPPSLLDNPIGGQALLPRTWSALGVLSRYLWLHLWPLNLSADYSYRAILPAGPLEGWAFAGGAALLLILWACLRLRAAFPPLAFGLGFFVLAWLPVSNALFPIGTVMAERLIYLPSAGLFLALGGLLPLALGALGMRRTATALALSALAAVLSAGTLRRNLDWREELSLWQSAVRAVPLSARAHKNLGAALREKGRHGEALVHLERAVSLFPGYDVAYLEMGLARQGRGEAGPAEAAYWKAIAANPLLPEAYSNLGALYAGMGRAGDAEAAFRRALSLDPRAVETHFNLGTLLLRGGRVGEALRHLEGAIRLDPRRGEAHHNLAAAYLLLGRKEEARRHLEEASRLGVSVHPGLRRALGR